MESRAEFQKLKSLCPGIELREQEPLRAHTSFQIGGPAALMAFPKTPGELQRLLMAARECGVRLRVLGAGTNVLAPDAGLPELVICTRGCLLGLRLLDGGRLEAMAGETLSRAAVFAREHSLTGLEFAHGIPGTVGGGVYMNAGAYGGELAQIAVETTVLLTDGTQRVLRGEEQAFGYRTSAFEKLDCVIVKTVFELRPGDPGQIQARMRGADGKAPRIAAAGASVCRKLVQAPAGRVCRGADRARRSQGKGRRRRAGLGEARRVCGQHRRRDGQRRFADHSYGAGQSV